MTVTTRWLPLAWLPLLAGCGSGLSPRAEESRGRPAAAEPVIATGTTADGRALRLRVVQDDAGSCLLVSGLDAEVRGCGRLPMERRPPIRRAVLAEATVARDGAERRELFAVTSARVARVRVRTAAGAADAVLMRATDRDALRRAGVRSGPFGYVLAEVSRTARRVRVVAFDARGNRLGSAGFGRFMRMGERFVAGRR